MKKACHIRAAIDLALPAAVWLTLSVLPAAEAIAANTPVQCIIEPAVRVSLRPAVSAQIANVLVDRGAQVKKGQPLVLLDATVERAALASARFRSVMEGQVKSAEARAANSQAKFRRRDELQQQKFVSVQDRDDAAAEMRIAEADLVEARDNRELARLETLRLDAEIARRQLISPINGVVVERLQQPGELAQAGEGGSAILKLAQVDPARIELVLPVARTGRLKVGDVVKIRAESPFDKETLNAVVKVVDPVVDSASGTFGVRLEVPNPRQEIPLGVKCVAELASTGLSW